MFKKIENPAACEMQSVIRFLNAKNMTPAEIHRQLCDVYGEHAMSSSVVRRWVRLFNEGRENVHDDQRSGRPSVVMKIWCVQLKRRLGRTDDSPLRHFPCISSTFTVTSSQNCVWGQRSRYFLLCIAGGIILRWRDTKTGARLWQVPQQWWELCRKVVYGMCRKWQYTWFVIYFCFFLIAHRIILSGQPSYFFISYKSVQLFVYILVQQGI